MLQNFNISESLLPIKVYINNTCEGREAWEIIALTFFTTCVIYFVNKFITDLFEDGFVAVLFRNLRKLPFIKQGVAKEMKSTTDEIEKELMKGMERKIFLHKLPKQPWGAGNILKEIENYISYGKYLWHEGYVSGTFYPGNDEAFENMIEHVYGKTAYTNPLHTDVFPGIRVMEAEIVHMVSVLFNAPEAIGTVTTGGTESIFLVCKAYRDFAKSERGIKSPNMIIPVTAHAAFDKAAQLLKIQVKHIKCDSKSMKVNIQAMKKAIDKNTCMLVGSAPAFPHGCMDDIEEIAKLGCKYDVPVHVDGCLGGFLLPFVRKAGFHVPPFDFTVKGVTSISVDTHKYAFAPKGTSVILYKNKIHRHYQFSVTTDWPGGIYGTPNLSGSRSGGVIATCWASLLYHGEEGYVEATKKIISVTKYVEKGLREIEGIFVFGEPNVSVIAIGSDHFDVYRLSSALTDKGWNLNLLQYPSGFHICFTMQHTYEGVADKFLSHVRECTKEILKDPVSRTSGTAAIYGMAQQIPDRSLVKEIVWAYLDACYSIKKQEQLENGTVEQLKS
ncbi:sphingosine-1-phosphate lyase [Trichonephila inaurata madagascariensis]|uniref:sphinganine-1-phosphate aldolase n=1 Tax=Trichonephila inaurata madagascariensis TaxID=2747483 RepID=A0A8X7C8G0_9ARAC|nr:sphingosine-1-phosphate lyase [Trichonephila inaurata madagascariensis]